MSIGGALQKETWNKLRIALLAACALLGGPAARVQAHGGEDHGDQKVTAAPAGGGLLARVARAGDYEITLKQPNLEPDKETAARLFVTRYNTNEPIAKANVVLLMQDADGARESAAKEGATPGLYELKLPPLRSGTVRLSARVGANNATETADFGPVLVAAPPVTAPADGATWARTALLTLGWLTVFGLLAGFLWLMIRRARRGATEEEIAAA